MSPPPAAPGPVAPPEPATPPPGPPTAAEPAPTPYAPARSHGTGVGTGVDAGVDAGTGTRPGTVAARLARVRHAIRREDVVLALGYFALFWLLDAVGMQAGSNAGLDGLAGLVIGCAVLGCLAVVLRRAATLVMVVVCAGAAVVLVLANHAAGLLLLFEVFFALVLFGSDRVSARAGTVAVALTAAVTLLALAVTGQPAAAIVTALVAGMTLLMPVEWAGNVRKAQLLAASEHARVDAVQQASHQQLRIVQAEHELVLERERAHLARELHDVVSARLSAIALQSGAALHLDTPPSALLTEIRAESVAGLAELGTMIRLLHTGALEETAGHVADLPSLVEQYQRAGTPLSFRNALPDAGASLPAPVQTALFRITAEALVNASRHAPGQPITLTLTGTQTAVALTISNPVPAVDLATLPGVGSGTGIPSMHFRAAHADGTLSAGRSGEQWKVTATLPATPSHSAASAPPPPESRS